MSLLGPVFKRESGGRQPYIPLGPFHLRLPFIHYRFEAPDYIQGLIMCAVCLGIIPILTEYLGMPFEIALTVVMLNGFLYLWHAHLGDPVVPGWITPAIPLLLLWLKTYPEGVPRMHALIAFECELGVLSLLLGATGLAKRFVDLVPDALKAGILLGAGVAAVRLVFEAGGRFDHYPWTIAISIGFAFFILFSNLFKSLRNKHKLLTYLSDLGLLPALVLAIFIAPIFRELPWPTLEWGFTTPHFVTLFTQWTPFSARIGFPAFSLYVAAAPLVFATYIVLFGEPNRNNMIVGLRNITMSMIGPDASMCGPMWAAMQVVECERYKHGREAMDSLFGGMASFRLGTFTGYFLAPIVTLVKPILPIALSLTMLIQGYVAVRVGILKARTFNDLGVAGVVGAVLVSRGAAYAFGVGIVLCVLIYGRDFFRRWPTYNKTQDPVFNARISGE
ncbi:MAG: hypothetical protein ABSH17_14420 [Syntrophobacteraceae bacterium]